MPVSFTGMKRNSLLGKTKTLNNNLICGRVARFDIAAITASLQSYPCYVGVRKGTSMTTEGIVVISVRLLSLAWYTNRFCNASLSRHGHDCRIRERRNMATTTGGKVPSIGAEIHGIVDLT